MILSTNAIVNRIGTENYRYFYTEIFHGERSTWGGKEEYEPWMISSNGIMSLRECGLKRLIMCVPSYRRMAKRMVRLINEEPHFMLTVLGFQLTVPFIREALLQGGFVAIVATCGIAFAATAVSCVLSKLPFVRKIV